MTGALWPYPIDISTYDCSPQFSPEEVKVLAQLVEHLQQPMSRYPRKDTPELQRLIQPLRDLLVWFEPEGRVRMTCLRHLTEAMHREQLAYWGWDETTWARVIRRQIDHRNRGHVNHHLMLVAYLYGNFSDFRQTLNYRAHRFACKLFGVDALDHAITTVLSQLQQWGYESATLPLRNQAHNEYVAA